MSDADKQDIEMNRGLTMDEYDCLQARLRVLPDTPPPRAVWDRIKAQGRAEGLIDRPVVSVRTRWLAGTGIAAAVVLAVLNLPAGRQPADPGSAAGDGGMRTVPAYNPQVDRYDPVNALMVQSQLLERDLRMLPEQPEVARAGTLATIDDLEARIGAIDYRLSDPQASLTRAEQEMYWRERVRLLDSLVQLRYAQAQRVSF